MLLDNMYRSYEYYTHSRFRYLGTSPSGYLYCSHPALAETENYERLRNSTIYKVHDWETPYTNKDPCIPPECIAKEDNWTCAKPNEFNEMRFNSDSYRGLFILFRHRSLQVTENVTLLPIDLSHWQTTFEQSKCVKIQITAFHHYCFCMGANKSEWFCKRSVRPQKMFGDFSKWIRGNEALNATISPESTRTSLNLSTTIVYGELNEEDDWVDDAWRWHVIEEGKNSADSLPLTYYLFIICAYGSHIL
ncbi:hypothetical protein DdX_20319 [Ditylenchus destructor]|uniref:Uncharacterized protein n=1 Tax=Ditylenchus destructor TaxID=166010 RepID=A0AAD4QWH2_9BILA|nr:hypothetical protein DdX_20319 [Ditylenchus destructor]